ncbi:uncharacterized protein TrAtP1_000138 [Trichoderma atroviride]|uniref:Uncharacterized protein n=1 Tax=Hypocrea atroviridis (strain ATCC 20476 / IMI 206040) TaxID=452589 RepID=G9NK20_HYPAI|nr:uncharacterized protein TRIATDRAFT_297885 [Trichoderma atroviride IMI 206040]EHK49240.1 hypothetical protein TRIATDRAFT_297885 [Trichoderma atroviride IMI 206040]UKZ58815.1 hypothetical protein TrAtP1_000138 [Trichoderma atroviride]
MATTGSSFTFSSPANTDVWKKPPSHDVFTAPYHSLSKNPFSQFQSASLTFTTTYTHQFDQAGLILVLTKPSSPSVARKWIKTGVELFDNQSRLSTVCCDNWADWSVANASSAEDIKAGRKAVTILVERLDAHDGSCLWVYRVDGETKVPMREICWPYGEDGGKGWELEIGALVARPTKDTEDELEVKFQDFQVKWDTA